MAVKWILYTCPTCGYTSTQREDMLVFCYNINKHKDKNSRIMKPR